MMRHFVTAIAFYTACFLYALGMAFSMCGCSKDAAAYSPAMQIVMSNAARNAGASAQKQTEPRNDGRVCSFIESIGPADREGWAGATLDNGTYVVAHYPSVGAQVCYRLLEPLERPRRPELWY